MHSFLQEIDKTNLNTFQKEVLALLEESLSNIHSEILSEKTYVDQIPYVGIFFHLKNPIL